MGRQQRNSPHDQSVSVKAKAHTTKAHIHNDQPESVKTKADIHNGQSVTTKTKAHTRHNQSVTTKTKAHTRHNQSVTTKTKAHIRNGQSVTTKTKAHIHHGQSVTTKTKAHIHHGQSVSTKPKAHIHHGQSVTTKTKAHIHNGQSVTTKTKAHIHHGQSVTTKTKAGTHAVWTFGRSRQKPAGTNPWTNIMRSCKCCSLQWNTKQGSNAMLCIAGVTNHTGLLHGSGGAGPAVCVNRLHFFKGAVYQIRVFTDLLLCVRVKLGVLGSMKQVHVF